MQWDWTVEAHEGWCNLTYSRKTWKDIQDPTFDTLNDPPLSAENLNNIEQGIADAHAHIADAENPHEVTKEQIGLSNVTNDVQLKASQLETTLTNSATKIPSSSAVASYIATMSIDGGSA